MALSSAAYSAVHDKTSGDLSKLETKFNEGHHLILTDMADDAPHLAALVFQIQKMQDELTYLRTEISANKDKTGITTDQANAITANTAKTSMTLGTTASTALAGDTKIPSFAADDTSVLNTTKSTTIRFGNFTTVTGGKGGTTYSLPITVTETTVVSSGKGAGTTTLTKTGSITLT